MTGTRLSQAEVWVLGEIKEVQKNVPEPHLKTCCTTSFICCEISDSSGEISHPPPLPPRGLWFLCAVGALRWAFTTSCLSQTGSAKGQDLEASQKQRLSKKGSPHTTDPLPGLADTSHSPQPPCDAPYFQSSLTNPQAELLMLILSAVLTTTGPQRAPFIVLNE